MNIFKSLLPIHNNKKKEIVIGILNGGKSSRMGSAKSLIEYKGSTLAERAYQTALKISNNVYFIGNSPLPSSIPISTQINDANFEGPLGGLIGLYNIHKKPTFIWAIDMPLIEYRDIKKILSYSVGYSNPVIPFNKKDEIYEVLCAFYPLELLKKIANLSLKDKYKSLQYIIKSEKIKGNTVLYKKLGKKLKSWNNPVDIII